MSRDIPTDLPTAPSVALRGAWLAPRSSVRPLIAVLLLVTGCNLYSHGDDDCPVYELSPGQEIRDPLTGQCRFEQVSCDSCVPCAVEDSIGGGAVCGGPCEALSETACLDARSCHAAYRTDARGTSFVGCWAVAVGGPPSANDCTQLDVHSCPFRNDCTTWYAGPSNDNMTFDHCALERESCEPGTCGAPPPCPSSSVPTTRNGCYTGRCMARSECPKAACADLTSETQCTSHSECEPLFRGDDCTCTPDTCTCARRTFESCHDGPA